MQFKFTFIHMEALESIEEYARHRIEKTGKYSLYKEPSIQFIFSTLKQRTEFKVELLFNAGHIHFASSAKTADMYASIDKAVTKMEKQLLKHKEKVQEHHSQKEKFKSSYKDLATPESFDMLKKVD
jgi:putative sigma-54 modulation protein